MKKTCLITGGNSGIGKAAAIQIAAKGYQVIIGTRNQERGAKAVEEIKSASGSQAVGMVELDLASRESITSAAKSIQDNVQQLDVLIHNAADFDISRKAPVQSPDGIETVWMTNHIGPVMFTEKLMDLMEKSEQGRIITVASQGLVMHPGLRVDLEDPEFKTRKFSVAKAYYQSKLAQVMYTYWLGKEKDNSPITVNCIRVTNVKIDLERYPNLSKGARFAYRIKSRFSISPEKMAETYTMLATDPSMNTTSGKYFDEKQKTVKSSKYSMTQEEINKVMTLTRSYL